MHHTAWYRFPFFDRLGALWTRVPTSGPHAGRKWERRLALSAEYVIKGTYGWLLGLGPRERDLMAFTEERFASFLEGYLAQAGPVRLHLDLFAFYALRWVLQEIADYGSRLLLEPVDAEGQAHAWRELQPYLPIPHAALATDHEAVWQTLAPCERTGQVTLHAGTP